MKKSLTPVLASRILMGVLFLAVILVGTGFYFANKQLQAQATKTNHSKIDSELVEDEINRLKILRTYLSANQSKLQRASEVVAESQLYSYQNQVIDDINTYAQRTGLTILAFDFPPTPTKLPAGAPALPAGLKKITLNVSVNGPIPYSNFMRFVRSIEQNLTKLQVTSLTLTPDEQNRNNLTDSSIGLEVYIR